MCQMVSVKTNFNTEIQVADIKKDAIENIIEATGVCTRICQIILFGSVLKSRCQEESDIDMLVVSDTMRSKLYKDKGYQEFLKRLHKKDAYEQMYDVICVHGMEEVYQKRDSVGLFRDVKVPITAAVHHFLHEYDYNYVVFIQVLFADSRACAVAEERRFGK